jgi:hypothetical protein
MIWLDTKYIGLVSSRLRNFKQKDKHLWNFSCPICGDSKTNQYRARGYFYEEKGSILYKCHNCSICIGFSEFLRGLDKNLYGDYIKEKFLSAGSRKFEKLNTPPKTVKQTLVFADHPLKSLKKISQLEPDHRAKEYLLLRQIPEEFLEKLYYAPEFKSFVNELIPGKFEKTEFDEPRIIIPFFTKTKKLFGFQGRTLNPKSSIRYITIILHDDEPKFFNLEIVDFTKTTLVLEGPLDSLFLSNAIASAGGTIVSELPNLMAPKERFVIIYDNEPRNKETVKKMKSAINKGYKICIMPDSVENKDINNMILSGYTKERIEMIVRENIYQGMRAELRMNQWKRV